MLTVNQANDQRRPVAESFPVRLTEKGGGIIRDNRALRAGDVIEVSPWDAGTMVRLGEAEYVCRVRALRDGLTIGARTLAEGEESPCAPDVAAKLSEQGYVRIVRK